uniref:RWP-RK domain-containing protein n=1 Tax=Hanusia phi TaxID=3032 RepID=A0A7S0EKL4_9CRYP|mmetsp:Transcript_25669/g.57706  ORF Transcript_25669/g.57706 Transcript_25669/m.57706 type:complete len:167 (+) Transcript_25669:240-740(+)
MSIDYFEPDWHALLALPPLGEDWAVALDAVGIPDEPEDELDGSMLSAERLTALCSPASTRPGSVAPCPASGTAAGAARLRSPPARPDVVVIHSRQLTAGDSPVEITRERLAEHFHESLEVAAAKIGIGKSTMKLVCRRLGVEHWPYKHQGRRRSKAGSRGEASSSE